MIYINLRKSKKMTINSLLESGIAITITDMELFVTTIQSLAFYKIKKALISDNPKDELGKIISITDTIETLFDKDEIFWVSIDFVSGLINRGLLDNSCKTKEILCREKELIEICKYRLLTKLSMKIGGHVKHLLNTDRNNLIDLLRVQESSKIKYLSEITSVPEHLYITQEEEFQKRVSSAIMKALLNRLSYNSIQSEIKAEFGYHLTYFINQFLLSETWEKEVGKFQKHFFDLLNENLAMAKQLLPIQIGILRADAKVKFTANNGLVKLDIPHYGKINYKIQKEK